MPVTRASGDDGDFSFTGHGGGIRAWSLTFPRVVVGVTAFTDTLDGSRTGLIGISGTARGTPQRGTAGDSPNADVQSPGEGESMTATLVVSPATCAYTLLAVITDMAMSSDKLDAATIAYQFIHGDEAAPSEVWDEVG